MVVPIQKGEEEEPAAPVSAPAESARSARSAAREAAARSWAEVERERLKKESKAFQAEFNLGYVGSFANLASLINSTQDKSYKPTPADKDKLISGHEYVDTFRLIKLPEKQTKLALVWAHADHATRVIVPDDNVRAVEFKGEYELGQEG